MHELPAELRDVLCYDPATGHFTWLIRRQSRGKVLHPGDRAGTPKDGYIQIVYTDSQGVRHQLRAHRLAWWFVTGVLPNEVDHIDRNRSNNAWRNLREVTRTQNNLNAGIRTDNVSGKRGVSWNAPQKNWMARMTVNGRIVYQQYFAKLEDAIAARKRAELEHVGRASPS